MSRETGTRWMFTLNNYVSKDEPAVWFDGGEGELRFITWKPEKAPSSGTKHLQGYLVLKPNPRNKNGRSLKWMKDTISKKAHWQICRGTHQDNLDYVAKLETADGDVTTLGEFVDGKIERAVAGRKKQHDVANEVKEAIMSGVSSDELWKKYFNYMTAHHKAMDIFRLSLVGQQRTWQTKVLVLIGPPGTGKSHFAKQFCLRMGGGYWVRKPKFGGTAWFDGYDPIRDPVLVFDEHDGSVVPFEEMNRICDKYPHMLEAKGTMIPCLAKWVIICSNKAMRDWYSLEAVDDNRWQAWVRRCSEPNGTVRVMSVKYTGVVSGNDNRSIVAQVDEVMKLPMNDDDDNDAPNFEAPDSAEYEECSQDYNDLYGDDEPDEIDDDGFDDELGIDDLNDAVDDLEYEEERYGAVTQPLGASSRRLLSGGVIDLDSADERKCQNSFHFGHPDFNCIPVEHVQKKLKRTDSTTFGLEKQHDKRWGKQPVQSKIAVRGPKLHMVRDEDDDVDDK